MRNGNHLGRSRLSDASTDRARGNSDGRPDQFGHLRTALDSDAAGISIFDSSGRLEYVNPAFFRIYGLQDTCERLSCLAEELEALLIPACLCEMDARRCVVLSHRDAGSPEQLVVSLSNGQQLQIAHHNLPGGGWYTRHIVAIETSKRRAPIDELISLQTLIDQVPDYLWVKDVRSRFVVANLALAKDHGYGSPDGLTGLTDFDLHASDAASGFQSREREILATGEPMIDQEEAVIDATGQEKWLSSSKMPLRDASGEIVGLIGVARDITPRKKAEALGQKASELEEMSRQLKTALERERQVNALQSQFVSMASHEFRTPLAIIDAAAQRLTRRGDDIDPAFVASKTEQIRGAVNRMVELMESILSFGRLEAGKVGITPTKCSLPDILAKCCASQQRLTKDHDISLHLEALPVQISVDRSALEQVFTNLLSNAVKYSPGAPKIDVRAWAQGGSVHVSVRDHGIGIDEDDMSRMFERYFRARNSTGIAGTGIGLNLVKQIVDLHGGQVTVQSKRGEGSMFTVSLPSLAPDDATQSPSDTSATAEA